VKHLPFEELVAETRNAIKPMRHSQSTLWQYEHAWRELRGYFAERGISSFSVELAEQFVLEVRQLYENRLLKEWKFKLLRKAVALLTEYHEVGSITWKHVPRWGKEGLKNP